MAKGNLILGMGRGKIGDIVVTRGAGEQISRARNRNPKNPKTTKQMAQRAALATCVEFFTRGRKNLFKFAFESKRKGESDYNAFVRANIGIVPVQSRKSLVENNSVFGPFIVSQGSLPQPAFVFDEENEHGSLYVTSLPAGPDDLTIGQLSKCIADYNGLLDGDIITIVAVSASGDNLAGDMAQATKAGGLQMGKGIQKWFIKQFTLDFNSTAKASTLGIFEISGQVEGATLLNLFDGAFGEVAFTTPDSSALAVIASRNTPSGLKVSTSTMVCGDNTAIATELGQSDAWKIWVAQHWDESASLNVAPENILEGSLSEN